MRATVAGFLLCLGMAVSQAAEITTSWTPPTTNSDGSALTDLSGYTLYYWLPRTGAMRAVPVGLQSRYTLTGLLEGQQYILTISARDRGNNESAYALPLVATARTPRALPTVRINFQPDDTGPVPGGYAKDTGVPYAAARGYGWTRQVSSRRRAKHADVRLDTFTIAWANATETWRLDLPNGRYLLSLACGDPAYAQGPHRVVVEGQPLFTPATTAKNQYITITDRLLSITHGTLEVVLGGTNGVSLLNYLLLIPVAEE